MLPSFVRASLVRFLNKNIIIDQILRFVKVVQDLKYEEKPDYEFLSSLLVEAITESGDKLDWEFNWGEVLVN